jgi:YD repeat-containing protein
MRILDYYPTTGRSELTSTTETNYFSDGTSLVNTTLFEYDPNYFDVTKTTNYNSDGTIVENREYHPYHYTIAGSLLSEMTSNNIISPVVNREVYIKKAGSTSYQMTSGEIQEFQKTSENFIKPLKFDFFKSATPVDEAIVSPFVSTTLIRNPSLYEERVLFEKYDASGNLQQQRKANDQAVSYIWDYNSALPIAEIKNASQSDAAYTSFESTGTGNWSISPFVTDTSEGLTGTSCYNLASGSTLTFNLAASQNYSISLWAKPSTSVYINDVLQVSTGKTVKGWLLYSSQITGASSVTIKGTGKIDELRIAPTNAIINTATYDPLYGVIATVDPNNVITFYEYDLMGRLKLIRDEKNNITKRYEYNYQLK